MSSGEDKSISTQLCVALYRDGVRCQIGEHQPIYKDISHVNYCTMHSHT